MKRITSYEELKVGKYYIFFPGIYYGSEDRKVGYSRYVFKLLKKEDHPHYKMLCLSHTAKNKGVIEHYNEAGKICSVRYSNIIPYFELTKEEVFAEII